MCQQTVIVNDPVMYTYIIPFHLSFFSPAGIVEMCVIGDELVSHPNIKFLWRSILSDFFGNVIVLIVFPVWMLLMCDSSAERHVERRVLSCRAQVD